MTALHAAPTSTPLTRLRAATTDVPSQPVPLRVVPSRRYPGPLPAPRAEPGDPVTGRLVVDTSHSALSPHLRGREVTVRVSGRRHSCPWGRTVIDLPAGRHLVEIEVEHGAGWGRVTEAVPVAAGSWVPVCSAPPCCPGRPGPSGRHRRPAPARCRRRWPPRRSRWPRSSS